MALRALFGTMRARNRRRPLRWRLSGWPHRQSPSGSTMCLQWRHVGTSVPTCGHPPTLPSFMARARCYQRRGLPTPVGVCSCTGPTVAHAAGATSKTSLCCAAWRRRLHTVPGRETGRASCQSPSMCACCSLMSHMGSRSCEAADGSGHPRCSHHYLGFLLCLTTLNTLQISLTTSTLCCGARQMLLIRRWPVIPSGTSTSAPTLTSLPNSA
mmetsp:Transcript_3094/g.8961  ORF Transcript_3094/g.8961 Transcript_3094/m.8961 type:complete len:212 (+) Transcript_3094:1861-2496(+)